MGGPGECHLAAKCCTDYVCALPTCAPSSRSVTLCRVCTRAPVGPYLCSSHELPTMVEELGGRVPARDFLQPWIHGLGFEGEYRKDCLVDPPERLAVGGALKRFEAERVFAGSQ